MYTNTNTESTTCFTVFIRRDCFSTIEYEWIGYDGEEQPSPLRIEAAIQLMQKEFGNEFVFDTETYKNTKDKYIYRLLKEKYSKNPILPQMTEDYIWDFVEDMYTNLPNRQMYGCYVI
jgi:uncharacterized protein YihD (DUF1040 family)